MGAISNTGEPKVGKYVKTERRCGSQRPSPDRRGGGDRDYSNCQNTHICKIHLKNLDLSVCFFPIRLQSTPPLDSVPVRMFLAADF